ncbi:hypothetical protein [Alicyclobacillus sp. SO9]|uniref:hypothetical protein n=1 Tax=Alicyclobacillus sp. SO9 TaxID=2665646 RepID=UPI0018E76082|nr:hypothetical protein [Alicyclobacillus sp. SO9]QQE80898.1 hypothetical protein GI364_11235 [Alicyclobacillus sp. SO9]
MIKEAFKYIVDLANTKVTDVEGRPYSNGMLSVIKAPTASPITVSTLKGLVDYLDSEFDRLAQVMVHIESPTSVEIYSGFNRDMERDFYLRANAVLPEFRFRNWYDTESFNIALQSAFVTNDDRMKLLKLVGNVRDEKVMTFGDDGVSQQVKAKAGVATVENVPVPNPVYLAPFRTFVEVQQPESAFVFRMRSGDGAPDCALFEADGGAWKIEAVDRIREFLQKALEEKIASGNVTLIS